MPQHRIKQTIRLQPQTLHHLNHLASISGYGDDIGRVVDKLVRAYQATFPENKNAELDSK